MQNPIHSVEDHVLFSVKGHAGIITLNRPNVLNALSINMIRTIRQQINQWKEYHHIKHIIIEGAGERAFCAGGDVRAIYNEGVKGRLQSFIDFYEQEYKLHYEIRNYPKNRIALLDGITMGGGVGVSIHGSHRIATERLVFAMPETGIGLFPDVGGSWFLPRLPGKTGIWMGLTGAHIKISGALNIGIATHYVPAAKLRKLREEIIESEDVTHILEKISGEKDISFPEEDVIQEREKIDRHFSFSTIEEIIASLEKEAYTERKDSFAQKQLDILRTKSPTSLKLTLRQMQKGMRANDFAESMQMEYRMIHGIAKGDDFFEGVRAQIIDKDKKPLWRPSRLEDVDEALIDSHFYPPPQGDLKLDK